MSTVVERIREIIAYKRVSERHFCREIGVSNGFLSKVNDVGSDKLSKIIYTYPEINPTWLLTGSGEMLSVEQSQQSMSTQLQPISLGKGIPLVAESALRKLRDGVFDIQQTDASAYYMVPKFKQKAIDFMLEVTDSSMYPQYTAGDILACTNVRENTFIQWNKVHVIATREQGVLIKRIKKGSSDQTILAVSDNLDYEPFEIPKQEIIGMALVVGLIRLQ